VSNNLDEQIVSSVGDRAHIAEVIIDALVRDLKFGPGDFVYEKTVSVAFTLWGFTAEDILAGLSFAKQQRWLLFDADLLTYTLTQVGISRSKEAEI